MSQQETAPGVTLDDIEIPGAGSLEALSRRQPVLLVFLRHFGWIFCREAVADLAGLQPELARRGAAVVLVHQSPPEAAAALAREYPGAEAFHLLADPECRLYARFGLGRATLGEMLAPALWLRGTRAFLQGHRQGAPAGSVPQKPGAFVLRHGAVVAAHRYRTLGDRPDYLALLERGLRSPGAAPAAPRPPGN